MSSLNTFLEILGIEDITDDQWYEYYIDVADEALDDMEESEWRRLLQLCTRQPARWQVLCASALSGRDHPTAVAILETLLVSNEPEVAITSAESLDYVDTWSPREDHSRALRSLQDKIAPGRTETINRLLSRNI